MERLYLWTCYLVVATFLFGIMLSAWDAEKQTPTVGRVLGLILAALFWPFVMIFAMALAIGVKTDEYGP